MAVRPRLWVTAARQARRLARPQWWRHPPFLPMPDREYLRFRFETQYGTDQPAAGPAGGTARVRPDPWDLVTYLEWCREMPEPPRRRPRARR